jgi:UDP-N-acetylmuramyl pentapeptide synthase
MLPRIKRRFYFVTAGYFGFWAKFVLRRWKPRIILVTGSSGKTTLLHMIEAQLGEEAVYTHHANSAIGIPFHVLGLDTNITFRFNWIGHAIKAPLKAWRAAPKQNLYVVEADCDRPHEGEFISKLLKPEVVLWVSVYRTHTMNFDRLVADGSFVNPELAIAHEFGFYIAAAQRLVVVNEDQPDIVAQISRVTATEVKKVSMKSVGSFKLEAQETVYSIDGQTFRLPGIHPKEAGLSLQMVSELMAYLNKPLDPNYSKLAMPPSRSSVFAGKQNTTLIDSSYNTGLGAMLAMLRLFADYPAEHKWLVIGDILEQGSVEQEEHEKLGEAISSMKADRVIFLGPRTRKYSYPLVKQKLSNIPVVSFDSPKEVLDYIDQNIRGGEVMFFKGGRFLEGVIEQLLAEPSDASKLARREDIWIKRRQKWGLPG